MAIIEVKNTTVANRYPGRSSGCLYDGEEKLKDYFTEEKWMHLRKAKFGIPIAIYLKDLDEIIKTGFKSGVEHILGDIVWNPNYGS
ncbi:MAG: hypothetical protein QW304_06595 [Thermoproteota archaeon]